MKNAALAYKTLDYIKAHPEEWDQRLWHCGTTHCFAGLIELFTTGEDEAIAATWDVAQEALGVEKYDACLLFHGGNTLVELEEAIKEIFGSRPEPVCN